MKERKWFITLSMKYIIWFTSIVSAAFGQTTFKVFHNTLDPSVFGQNGGAILNATGDGFLDSLTLCIRFQGCDKILSHVKFINITDIFLF